MNNAKRSSRLLDLSRKGVFAPDLDGPDRVLLLGVAWPTKAESLIKQHGKPTFKNATKKPNNRYDRKLRRIVSRLTWIPTLLPGRKAK